MDEGKVPAVQAADGTVYRDIAIGRHVKECCRIQLACEVGRSYH
jgi:hypothetical protein